MHLLAGVAEGQVLQRQGARGATVTLSGTCTQDLPIAVTISRGKIALKSWKERPVGKAKAGKFTVKLAGIPAGGPYRLILRAGKKTAKVASFYVGDVWVLAGQSNMQGCGEMSGAARPHPLVRAFSMRRVWRLATDPLHVVPESPDACHAVVPCTPEQAERHRQTESRGVGAGVFFGRQMVERTGVPQGLICTAHGGTSMQQWAPGRKDEGGATLYGSMLLSVRATGQPVAGILWYQGESDANPNDAPLYTERMQHLVASSRRDLRQPRLPWVIVQIARVFGPDWQARAASWNRIQDEQQRLPKRVRYLETVSAIDLPLDDLIHIGARGFPLLADRLARAADRLVHGNLREKPTPRLKAIRPVQSGSAGGYTIDLLFEGVDGGLRAPGEASGFALVDQAGRDLKGIFKVTLHGDTARLHLLNLPPENECLYYGHGATPHANITDGAGRALLCFGPMRLIKKSGLLPFITTWMRTGVLKDDVPLRKISVPDVEGAGAQLRTYENTAFAGFINEHDAWQGKQGQAYFSARIELPERMKLQFLMGYDGPFRLWIDERPFWNALKATNPCLPDEGAKTVTLARGMHELRIAMDLNDGLAWGFCLRLRRLDLTRKQIATENFPKPVYSV